MAESNSIGYQIKDVPGGFPKSDLLGVTVALIHVADEEEINPNTRNCTIALI